MSATLWKETTLLVTGGTGSFGRSFIATVFNRFPGIKRLIVYSRDEQKQYELSLLYPKSKYPAIEFYIGDVRDAYRLKQAMEDVDVVVHAAALKQVPSAELNQMECIKTNIFGAENVIQAALDCEVKRVIALSTDKAAAPSNLYGATKLCSDKLFISANNLRGRKKTIFSVVRYGNVMGSRGSVIPYFLDKRTSGVLPLTNPQMTRFNITAEAGVDFVLMALEKAWGGEIFLPKIPSFLLKDLATAIAPECKIEVTGIRPGEKLHEEMITETDALQTVAFDGYYVILPSIPTWDSEEYIHVFGGKRVTEGFKYHSDTNSEWLSVPQIRQLIKRHVVSDFDPL